MNQTLKKFLLFLLKLFVAAAILTWLILRVDIKWDDVLSVSPVWPLLAAFCLYAQIFLSSIRWHLLLRCSGIRITYLEALSLTMQGVFFTLFIPAGSVGGDLIKAGILAKRAENGEKFNGVFTILMDRICGLIALIFVVLISSFCFLPQILNYPAKIRMLVWSLMLAGVALLCGVLAAFFHDLLFRFRFFRALLNLADRYSKGAFSKASEAMTFYRAHWRLLLVLVLVTTFVLFSLLAGAVWVLAYGVTGGTLSAQLCYLASNLSQAVGALPLTNGGMGTRELVCTEILKTGDCTAAQATLIPILYVVVFFFVSLSGSLFFIFDSLISRSAKKNDPKP